MIHDQSKSASISVVIVNHNAGSLLLDCVESAFKQAHQIIVVDNASTDSSLAALQARFPQEQRLQIIPQKKNLGFSAGCNIGLTAATNPYILFLNPDCILQQNALQHMTQVMESDQQIGMVSGYLTNPDGTEQGGGRRAIPTPWRAFVRAFGLHHLEKFWPQLFFDFHLDKKPRPTVPTEVEAISGALMLVRRQAIETVGNWDEGYFLHCEDLDWCMRFQQKGWKIVFVPDAPAIHFKGTCSQARPFFVAWHKHKGMVRFYKKFFGQKYSPAMICFVTLGVWLKFSLTVLIYSAQYFFRLFEPKHK